MRGYIREAPVDHMLENPDHIRNVRVDNIPDTSDRIRDVRLDHTLDNRGNMSSYHTDTSCHQSCSITSVLLRLHLQSQSTLVFPM